MLQRKIALLILSLSLCLVLMTGFSQAEEFEPIFTFHTNLGITVESYFGNYPLPPKVVIPDDVPEEDLDEWERREREDQDVRSGFDLCNPTAPGIIQNIKLQFYGAPTPDLEAIVQLRHRGLWGGDSMGNGLSNSLTLDEVYVNYLTNWGMITAGKFTYELDTMGLLIGDNLSPKEGIAVYTVYKDVWYTGVYNRLLTSVFPGYPYVASSLQDNLIAFRVGTFVKDNYLAMNLLGSGFDNESGLTVDYKGEVFGRGVKGEFGLIYPSDAFRKLDKIADHVWPGGIVSVNLVEDQKQAIQLKVAALSKGFKTRYGSWGSIDGQVGFNPNTGGFELIYQRGLTSDLLLNVDLLASAYLDCEYQAEAKKKEPTRMLEVKLSKYLNPNSNVSFSTAYLGDDFFHYGKINLDWNIAY